MTLEQLGGYAELKCKQAHDLRPLTPEGEKYKKIELYLRKKNRRMMRGDIRFF